jgi:hypothetical protein
VPGAAAPNFCWRRLPIFGGAPARRRAANFTAAAAPDIFSGAPNFFVATSNAIHQIGLFQLFR